MGLRERQLVQTMQTQDQAMMDRLIYQATHGGAVLWQIDWDSFVTSEAALKNFRDGAGYWGGIANAFDLAAATIGPLELKRHVKTVIVKNHPPPFKGRCACEAGVLTVEGAWGAEVDPFAKGHPPHTPSDAEMARAITQDYQLSGGAKT